MSWSASIEGRDKDKVLGVFIEQIDHAAKSYPVGTPEGDDIAAVKARAIELVGKFEMMSGYNGIAIKASGSHSSTGNGICAASLRLEIIPLQLPPETPLAT